MKQYFSKYQLNPGAVLNSGQNIYVIESVLGHGTFGITYTARILKGRKKGKVVAIKEFFVNGISSREESGNVSSCSDTVSIERCKAEFIAEAKNLIELNHPNIVKAHEVFEANGTVYYSMDYIEGENLNSYLRHKSLTVDEAVKIITKIAYALSYMHESQHMLHLDLKPGNVMRRSSDGQIILIDFGLSRYFTEEELPEGENPVGSGTKGYAPLEQSDFKNRHTDFKATIDVYALGATFYKLVTSSTPPPADAIIGNKEALTVNLKSAGLGADKISIIAKAMDPSPEKRYQSVMEFIYDINADERRRRKKGFIWSLVILIGIIVAIWGGLYWKNKHEVAKETYYNELDGYAFELYEFNQGANHYGEREYYKFLPGGKGLYLFVSWHDPMDCKDADCDLESRQDTVWFNYKLSGNNRILFETGFLSGFTGHESVTWDPVGNEIYVGDPDQEYKLLRINDETINWDLVEQIFK